MKIDPGLKQISTSTSTDARGASSKGAKPSAAAPQTEVTLSARAAELKQLETRLAAIPVVDRGRVEGIKEAIASGQYHVKPENIAEGLLDSVKEMLHVAK
jgi:negative regulator of flagellin synthesis FlgM